jgi:hypothetical protein
MARPVKTGLEYFPLDVNTDDKLELIEAEHGLQGFAIVIKLWQKIYSNGYFIEWNEDIELLFSRRINSEKTLINSVITSCFHRNLLEKTMYDKYGILTSTGIQRRFFNVCKQSKRSSVTAIDEYLLIFPEFTDIITELTRINPEISTQRKEKERKEKESNISFDFFWNLYDKKIGDKSKLSKKWDKLKDEERQAAIDYIPKYKESQPEKQYRKNPETFLNNKSWNDELIPKNKVNPAQPIHPTVLHRSTVPDDRF